MSPPSRDHAVADTTYAPGESSTVHHSLLDLLLFWPGIPFQVAIGVGVITLLGILTLIVFRLPIDLIWRVLGIGATLYFGVYLVLRDDPQRLTLLVRSLMYPETLPPDTLATYLPWQDIISREEAILSTRDAGVFTTFSLEPYDLWSLSLAERGAVDLSANVAVKRPDESWAFWLHGKRRPVTHYPQSEWPDEVSALMDEAYRQSLPHRLETQVYLTAWHQAPSTTTVKADRWFFTRRATTPRTVLEHQLDSFRLGVDLLQRQMAHACHAIERLTLPHLLRYLHGFISVDDHPIEPPENDTEVSAYLADCTLWPGITPVLGTEHRQEHLRVLTLTADLPAKTRALMWPRLYAMPFAFDWMTCILPMSRTEAASLATTKQLNWYGTQKGASIRLFEYLSVQDTGNDLADQHSRNQADDANAARAEMLSDDSSLGQLQTIFLVRASTEADADDHCRMLQGVLQGYGCPVREEGLGAVDYWFAMNPGQRRITSWMKVAQARTLKVKSLNIVHLGCFYKPYAGTQSIPHLKGPALTQALTEGSNPFGVSPYVGDLGNVKKIGPKGSGKSTELNWEGAQWGRYPGSYLLNWDVGGSSEIMTRCLGGSYHNVLRDGLGMQLMKDVDDAAALPWLLQWCLNRVEESGLPKHPDIGDFTWGVLMALHENPQRPRTYTHFLDLMTQHASHIAAEAASQGTARLQALNDLCPRILAALQPFAQGGAYGHILDAPVDRFATQRIMTFELSGLIRLTAAHAGVLEALFARIRGLCHGQPVRGHFDECSHYFRSPAFVNILLEDLTDWRRENFSAAFAMQSISQYVGTPLEALLDESCDVNHYYPNPNASDPRVAELYREAGCTETDIQAIARGTPKDQLYVIVAPEGDRSPGGRRLISIRLPRLAQVICGANSKADHALADQLLTEHPAEEFPFRWLDAKGFPDASRQVAHALARRSLDAPLPPVLDLVDTAPD